MTLISSSILHNADTAAAQNKLDCILCPKAPSCRHKMICYNLLIITAATDVQHKAVCRAVPAGVCKYHGCGCWIRGRMRIAMGSSPSILSSCYWWGHATGLEVPRFCTVGHFWHYSRFPGRLVGAQQWPSNIPVCCGCSYLFFLLTLLPLKFPPPLPPPAKKVWLPSFFKDILEKTSLCGFVATGRKTTTKQYPKALKSAESSHGKDTLTYNTNQ